MLQSSRIAIEPSGGHCLTDGWRMTLTDAGACDGPAALQSLTDFIDAPVPGTVAGALERAGRFDRTRPQPLNTQDAWYVREVAGFGTGKATLAFDGLATVCDVYWNGALLFTGDSMFVRHEAAVELTGSDQLAICFRALAPHLEKRGPRARWRPQMITPQGLRLVRTSLLGYMPGWCPEIHPAGPFRPIRLLKEEQPRLQKMAATLDVDGTGHLEVVVAGISGGSDATLACAGATGKFQARGDGLLVARLTIPNVEAWWPHSHGRPALHDVELLIDGTSHKLGRTGFRRIAIDRGSDGRNFALSVNGTRIFCRGAVWTTADIVDLPGDREGYEPLLRLAAEAGMNMLRIGGTMTYETAAFFRLCDELGILVWQDLMFANFDYPANDPDFVERVQREVAGLLAETTGSPSLAVLCGGSEMHQQAAMMGLPQTTWRGPLTEDILPLACSLYRPDVPYVPNSPSGGAMPFAPNEGVTHYYGVGAYCRPLEDARRANIRFAAESLAFANVPEQATLDAHLPVSAVHDPRWKERVPRDRGASWDFEDVRDHYLQELYTVDPARLRREDLPRYLDLSRAVSGEVMEAAFAEWRRPGSSCNGALVWTLQDLLPGAGWGVIDATGRPKPAWHALRRAFRPLQLLLSDEGTNGLDAHVVNDGIEPRRLTLELACLRDGAQRVVQGSATFDIAPRGTVSLAATTLFGAFFDTIYAFRFGPPAHDVTVGRLRDAETGKPLVEAFHFPRGRAAAMHFCHLSAELQETSAGYALALSTDRLAQSVHIDVPHHLPGDNWFHLAPGETRIVPLTRVSGESGKGPPSGEIRSLGSASSVQF